MERKIKEIIWTHPATRDLQNIYDYLAEISFVIADRQINRIVERIDLLEAGFTQLGQKEPLLKNKKHEYRYLIQDNYKIIYRILEAKIVIDAVFDCRQNPEKLQNSND